MNLIDDCDAMIAEYEAQKDYIEANITQFTAQKQALATSISKLKSIRSILVLESGGV